MDALHCPALPSATPLHRASPAAPPCVFLQLRGCHRFLALSKTSLWWMSPRFGSTADPVPASAASLLLPLPPLMRHNNWLLCLLSMLCLLCLLHLPSMPCWLLAFPRGPCLADM